MVDYSIEFAHIYVDQIFNTDYKKSSQRVKEIASNLEETNKSYNLALLIDDYNPKRHLLNVDKYINKLANLGLAPDYVVFESELTKLTDEVLSVIYDDRLRNSYQRYMNKKHIPCSFLVATWYLLRLGLLDRQAINFYYENRSKSFTAQSLINVLHPRYQSVEQKAQELISKSDYASRNDLIKCCFINKARFF